MRATESGRLLQKKSHALANGAPAGTIGRIMSKAAPPDVSQRRLGALGARLLWAAWRLLTSMRFAIALLLVIAVASVIGTLLPQQQPYSVYAGLYGAFWADVFEALGFFHVYQSTWYILMLAFLVASTSACMARHVPAIVRDWRNCKEDVAVPALQALGFKRRAVLPHTAQAAAQTLGQQLANQGWQVRLQERALAQGSGWMVAARKGRLNRIGYLAGHGAVVLICLGGLMDSNWLLRAQMAVQGKTPYQGAGRVAQVPAQHRLGPDTPGFRGHLTVAEGRRNDAAVVAVQNGVVIQDLPFAVVLLRFHVEHYPNGTPRMFASDVVLHDKPGGAMLPARIEVNRPLHHRGVTLYQSGFEDGGSRLTLRAVPMSADASPWVVQGQVGGHIQLEDGEQPRTLEIDSLQVMQVEDMEVANATAPQTTNEANDADKADAANSPSATSQSAASRLMQLLRQPTGMAHDAQAQQAWQDIGPSFGYKLRDAAGQATEFHNYMRPVQIGSPAESVPQYLFGVREQATQNWRYLRVPADADGGLDEFRRLRTALLQPQQRQQAAQRYAAQIAPAGDAELARQLAQSAQRVLDRFAGDAAQWPQARRDPHSAAARSFGLAGVAALVESQAPLDQQEQLAGAVLRMLNGSLLQLLQHARQQAGLPPLDMAQSRNQLFMSQLVIALSDAPLYPEPVWFMLQDFQQVQASVLQVARTPGKWAVYVGSTLLVLGVLAMLYVRERRLWIWLVPTQSDVQAQADAPSGDAAQALLAYSCARRNHDSAQEFARLAASLLQKGQDDNIIR